MNQQLIEKLVAVAECMDLHRKIDKIEGWLHPYEASCLYLMAALGDGDGEVVELGSYCGRSTCVLGLGLRDGHRGILYAVDHHEGSAEHQKGGVCESKDIVESGSTLNRMLTNVYALGVSEHVEPVVMTTQEASLWWRDVNGAPPIRLLFIDASHEYDAVRGDWLAWSPYVQAGGLVAFHDVGDVFPGVDRAFQEAVMLPDWESFCGFHHLHVIRKRLV